ncbi:MAG: glycosyltransferase family 39 protein [Planctomycetes bacterium]|nr:glycosyltransferase family 39 protein [Planctomycetota bacterium]
MEHSLKATFKKDRVTEVVIFIFFLALIFISKLPTLDLPYHWDEMGAYVGPAHWLAEGSMVRILPGRHPMGTFFGHPPGLYINLVLFYKVLGETIIVSHICVLFFSFLGVYYTYLLGKYLFNRRVGTIAAIFLYGTPWYFTQSGLVLGDLPITALGVMSVYYALCGRYAGYLISSVYMVMIKETSVLIIIAVLIYIYFTERNQKGIRIKLLKYGIGILVLGIFLTAQKIATGQFISNPYFSNTSAFNFSLGSMTEKTCWVLSWTFSQQNRWCLAAVILLHLLVRKKGAWIRPYFLFILIGGCFVGTFALVYFLRRYTLAVLPYYCLAGSAAVTGLIRHWLGQAFFVGGVLALFGTAFYGDRIGYSGYDNDLQYLDMISINRQACRYIEENFSEQRLVTCWPMNVALKEPYIGYVTTPLNVVPRDQDFEVMLFPENSNMSFDKLNHLIEQERLSFHKRFARNGKSIAIYTKIQDK